MKWTSIIGALMALGLIVGNGVAQGTTPSDAVATAQSALTTAQAGLVTPTIAATATKAPTATTVPTATPRPTQTPTLAPTATSTPDRSLRGTVTPVATTMPTSAPTVPPPTPDGVLQTYTNLVIIPTTYVVNGQTLRVPANEVERAKAAVQDLDNRVLSFSGGMGRLRSTVVVSDVPVTTMRQYCGSSSNCGAWLGPTDIRQAIEANNGAAYDMVSTYVPDKISGIDVMTCPCNGIAIPRYFSIQMYGTTIYWTTQVHETEHVIGDFWLRSQGFDNLPTCPNYDGWPVHCVYGSGNSAAFYAGYMSGTLPGAKGIDRTGWLYAPPTGGRADQQGAAEAEFPWTGSELPVRDHADGEAG